MASASIPSLESFIVTLSAPCFVQVKNQNALHIYLLDKLQKEGILVAVVHKEDPLFNGLEGIHLGGYVNACRVYDIEILK